MDCKNVMKSLRLCTAGLVLSTCLVSAVSADDVAASSVQVTALNMGGTLNHPEGVAIDSQGDVFIANYGSGVTGGGVTVIAGSETRTLFGQSVTPNQPVALNPGSPDLNSLVDNPWGLCVDARGDLFIANYSLRGPGSIVVVPGPTTSSLYGQSVSPGQPTEFNPGTVTALNSLMNGPSGIAINASGDLVISNYLDGSVVAVPGTTTTSLFGAAVSAGEPVVLNPGSPGTLNLLVRQPGYIAFDGVGNLYIDNYVSRNNITVIPASGTTSLFGQSVTPNQPVVLSPGTAGSLSSVLYFPTGMTVDAMGDLFVANTTSTGLSNIVVVPGDKTTSILGQKVTPSQAAIFDPGITGSIAGLLSKPTGIAFNPRGMLFVANYYSANIVSIGVPPPPAAPPTSKPTAPTNVTASIANGTATVSFTPGSSGNLATYDQIDLYINGVNQGNVCNVSGASTCQISNLAGNTNYSFVVTAINALGTAASEQSNTVSYVATTTTTTTTLPTVPTTTTTLPNSVKAQINTAVFFTTGSAVLGTTAKASLLTVAKKIVQNHFTNLRLDGYTDLREAGSRSVTLSQSRNNVVAAYLVTLLKQLHATSPVFVKSAHGITRQNSNLSLNRKVLITGTAS